MKATLSAETIPCLDYICKQCFFIMAGMDAIPTPPESMPTGSAVTCRIAICDEDGSQRHLVIRADEAFANSFAKRLFDMPSFDVAEEEIIDSIKELANTLGGNLKGLIETETTLSIPEAEICSHLHQKAASSGALKYCFENAGQCMVELCGPSNNC